MNKFKCVECGINNVDDKDEICDDCCEAYNGDDGEFEEDEDDE